MIKQLKSIYHRQQFFPNWFGVFVNPFYFARKGLSTAMIEMSKNLSGHLLDLGCGSKPYQVLFDVDAYVGLDIDTVAARNLNRADDFYDGKVFPYPDQSFDCILCNQVLEHVFNPELFLLEINRVLKPKGLLLLTVPFVWDEHEQPYDYARYSSFGLFALLQNSGFTIKQHRKLGADATLIFQLTNAYFYKISQSWPKFVRLGFTFSVMALVNILGVIAAKLLPDNPDLFLDHVVLAEKQS
jgi:SAM-dependent methyltransferase